MTHRYSLRSEVGLICVAIAGGMLAGTACAQADLQAGGQPGPIGATSVAMHSDGGGAPTAALHNRGTGEAQASAGPAAPGRTATPLDRRVALLAAELKLSAAQQIEVRSALNRQRAAVLQVWSDTTLAPAVRIARTQAISERTADDVRALLNDAQREKYIKPRPREAPVVGAAGSSLESWMGSNSPKPGP